MIPLISLYPFLLLRLVWCKAVEFEHPLSIELYIVAKLANDHTTTSVFSFFFFYSLTCDQSDSKNPAVVPHERGSNALC